MEAILRNVDSFIDNVVIMCVFFKYINGGCTMCRNEISRKSRFVDFIRSVKNVWRFFIFFIFLFYEMDLHATFSTH